MELDINPNQLSLEIGLDRSFVGKVENLNLGNKYSSNHLHEIARVLKCKMSDFFPDPCLEEDCIEEYHEIREANIKRKQGAVKKWINGGGVFLLVFCKS